MIVRFLLVSLILAFAISNRSAASERVDVELVLAVDVSWSMDPDEQRLQRDGYVAAFRHGDVIQAIREGGWGSIAVTFVEWAVDHDQKTARKIAERVLHRKGSDDRCPADHGEERRDVDTESGQDEHQADRENDPVDDADDERL